MFLSQVHRLTCRLSPRLNPRDRALPRQDYDIDADEPTLAAHGLEYKGLRSIAFRA